VFENRFQAVRCCSAHPRSGVRSYRARHEQRTVFVATAKALLFTVRLKLVSAVRFALCYFCPLSLVMLFGFDQALISETTLIWRKEDPLKPALSRGKALRGKSG